LERTNAAANAIAGGKTKALLCDVRDNKAVEAAFAKLSSLDIWLIALELLSMPSLMSKHLRRFPLLLKQIC